MAWPRLLLALLTLFVMLLPAAAQESDDESEAAEPATDLLRLGAERWLAGDYDGAVEALTRAIESLPGDARPYNLRALAQAARGELEAALGDVDLALELDAASPVSATTTAGYLDTRAYVLLKLDRNAEALAAYEAVFAFELQPADAVWVLGRGLAMARSGQSDQGRAQLEAGLRLAGQSGFHYPQLDDLVSWAVEILFGPSPVPGTVLLADDFGDPDLGWLPTFSPVPDRLARGYEGGEYVIRSLATESVADAGFVGSYRDVSIAVEARIIDAPSDAYIALSCRQQRDRRNGASEYRLSVFPDLRTIILSRFDRGEHVALLTRGEAAIRRGGASNRLELTCVGSTISARINGVEAGAVDDRTYREGFAWIGVGGRASAATARFDNLVVTHGAPARQATLTPTPSQQPAATPGPITPTPLRPSPTARPGAATILLADDFEDANVGWLPTSSPRPSDYQVGYEAGRYFIRKVNPDWDGLPSAFLPGSYADASIEVQVEVVGVAGEPLGRSVALFCRQVGNRGYRAVVDVDGGAFWLSRDDSSTQKVRLTEPSPSSSLRAGNARNHLELTCAGPTIAFAINGTNVAVVHDSHYGEGGFGISMARFQGSPGTAEAWLDDLVLSQATPAVGPTSTPIPTPTPVPTVTPSPPPAPGTVLLRDTFDDPSAGLLPRDSFFPDQYRRGYEDGEYVIQRVDPESTLFPFASLPGSYGDTMLAVDVRVVGETEDRYVALECRRSGPGAYGAVWGVDNGAVWVARKVRAEDADVFILGPFFPPDLRPAHEGNRFDLTCAGNLIALSVNGARVGATLDSTHTQGQMSVGAGLFRGTTGTVEARFDNLVVTQAAPPPTFVPTPTTVATPSPSPTPRSSGLGLSG